MTIYWGHPQFSEPFRSAPKSTVELSNSIRLQAFMRDSDRPVGKIEKHRKPCFFSHELWLNMLNVMLVYHKCSGWKKNHPSNHPNPMNHRLENIQCLSHGNGKPTPYPTSIRHSDVTAQYWVAWSARRCAMGGNNSRHLPDYDEAAPWFMCFFVATNMDWIANKQLHSWGWVEEFLEPNENTLLNWNRHREYIII